MVPAIDTMTPVAGRRPIPGQAQDELLGSMAKKGRKHRANRGPVAAGRKTRPDPFQPQLLKAARYGQAGQSEPAQTIFRQILEQQSSHPAANQGLASLLQEDRRPQEAIEHWRKVLQVQSDNLVARFAYARCLSQLSRLEEAAEQFKLGFRGLQSKKLRMPPDELSGLYYNLAEVYENLRQDEEEEKCLRRAIHLNPMNVAAHHMLGYVLDLLGRSAEAQESYRKALEIRPDLAEVHRRLSFSIRHTKVDDDVRAMETLYKSHGIGPADKLELAFGLGKAFEDLQEHETAFDYWREGNRLYRQLHPYNVEGDLVLGRTVTGLFTRDYIEAQAGGTSTDVTPVFIVSMPRSGSSLVEQILASHSAVYGAGELLALREVCEHEVERFPADLGQLNQADWRRMGTAYLEEVTRRTDGEAFITDKFPGNYNLIGPIRMMFPNAKVIHCARNPMDIALSCFKNIFQPGALPFSYDLEDLGVVYRAYEEAIAHWQDVLPGWFYEIRYEDLTADPESEVRKLLDFIGLPFEDGCMSFYEAKWSTRTASAIQVRQPINTDSVQGWKNYEQGLKPFADARRAAR